MDYLKLWLLTLLISANITFGSSSALAAGKKDKPAKDAPAAADASAEQKPSVDPAFVIGAEDVLFVRVHNENEPTGTQEVRPDGFISVPFAGEVKAAGLTPSQLADSIRDKLLTTMRNPQVTVQVLKVNSRKYIIQGEVNHPGTFTFATPLTVLEALSSSNGFKDFANVKKIYILRKGQKLSFNYKDVSHGKHTDQNVTIQNGDQIFVP